MAHSQDFTSKNFDLPENLFYFNNTDLKPLQFVLSWDTEDRFYFNLLNRFYADVIDEPNEYAMVLGNPETCSHFHPKIPAFDIKFIQDCFELGDYPDPAKYVIENTCAVKYSKDSIMACWFCNKKKWSDLIPIQENVDGGKLNAIQPSCSNKNPQALRPNLSSMSVIRPFSETSSSALPNKMGHRSGLNESMKSLATTSSSSPNKKTRLPYSYKEEQKIVEYIVNNKYGLNVTGTTVWQKMERDNICKIRSWQSMKERYMKHIKYDLITGSEKFPFLTPYDLKLLRQGLNVDAIRKKDKEALRLQFQDERMGSSDDSF